MDESQSKNKDLSMLSTIIAFISMFIALGSLGIVVYKEFLQSYSVSAYYDQLIVLALPQGNRNKIAKDIIINEMISGNSQFLNVEKYKSDPRIYAKYPDIEDAAKRKDKNRLSELFSNLKIADFEPPEDIIRKYFGVQAFSPTFSMALIIANSGAKFAHISDLYLIISSEEQNQKKWFFRCVMEVDFKSLVDRKDKQDVDRISELFTGTSVGPKEKTKLFPAFFPRWKIPGKKIISTSMTPGSYSVRVVGYGPDQRRVFKTKPQRLHLSENDLIKMFKGTDTSKLMEEPEDLISE